jgi:predicted acylesterase/phospholipase RssA
MKRAIVLNAGASWAAYQVGVLQHLVKELGMEFDLYAGTGIGAMHAALLACDEFDALVRFWDGIGPWHLVRPNLRNPWRGGPLDGTPQRRFIAAHVSEARLRGRGVEVLASVFDLQNGRLEALRYPGAELPLVDGLMAAVATPGMCPPIPLQGHQHAEATLIDGFLLREVIQLPVEEVVAIGIAVRPDAARGRRFGTWRSVLSRAIGVNQAHDVWSALEDGRRAAAAAEAFRRVRRDVPRVAEIIADPDRRKSARAAMSSVYLNSIFPLRREVGPVIRAITPSRDLCYPLWRFRHSDLSAARALGYRDARYAMAAEGSGS